MLKWKAWYEDGRKFSSADTMWQDLPNRGMVGVVVYEEYPYRRILDGGDWYWLENGDIHQTNTHEEWGQFLPAPDINCTSCLKRSGVMSDTAWKRIQAQMIGDRTWP